MLFEILCSFYFLLQHSISLFSIVIHKLIYFKFVYIYLIHIRTQPLMQSFCHQQTSNTFMLAQTISSSAIQRSHIFLPPFACGFTLPQGDSRWGSSISILDLGRSLLNTHCKALRTYVFERSLFFSFNTDMFLFHHMLSILFFLFSHHSAYRFQLLFRSYGFRDSKHLTWSLHRLLDTKGFLFL